MSDPVVFCDIETFGLDPVKHPPWEVAVIRDGLEYVWQIEWPDHVFADAETIALEMTGHAERSVQRGTSPKAGVDLVHPMESAHRFASLTDGRHLVGAVVSFDEERMRRQHDIWLGRPDRYPWHYHVLCVEALAIGFLQGRHTLAGTDTVRPPWKSDQLSAALGITAPEGEERHTALADARWAKRIYEEVMGQ